MKPTSDDGSRAAGASLRPHRLRYLIGVISIVSIVLVWRSHQALHEQLVQLAGGDYPSMPLLVTTRKRTIAYAVSLTSCNPETYNIDGAAVLKHSLMRFDASSNKYNSKFYAFVHPNATLCAGFLEELGYHVKVLPTPINATDIRGPLKQYVEGASCCGSKEFLKLYTYTLIQHPVALHLDLDVAVLKPLDDLYDAMLDGPGSPARSRLPAMWLNETELPDQIDAYFTRDYAMLSFAGYRKPIETAIQGGFLAVRPNRTVFQMYLDIILEGVYEPSHGWGANELRIGGTYGSAQIQGLVAYFYGLINPGTAVELNRCLVNNMVDTPTDSKGECKAPRDGHCEDCRVTNFSEVFTTHYTLCQKPWWCEMMQKQDNLCYETHHAWFQLRWDLEMERAKADPTYNVSALNEVAFKDAPWVVNGNWSYCSNPGRGGYRKLPAPPS